jgi:hypothetical protein
MIGHRCVECDEAITNPICPDCLAQRMQIAIGEKNKALAKAIRGINVEGKTECLFCQKKVGICPHCFSKDVFEYLEEKSSSLAQLFQSQFNFELRTKSIDL